MPSEHSAGTGVEPARPCDHSPLKRARLPIPPSGRIPDIFLVRFAKGELEGIGMKNGVASATPPALAIKLRG